MPEKLTELYTELGKVEFDLLSKKAELEVLVAYKNQLLQDIYAASQEELTQPVVADTSTTLSYSPDYK